MKRVHMRINGTRPHKNVQQIRASNRQEDKEIYTLYIYTCIRVKYNYAYIYIYDIYLRTSYRTVINSST